MRKIDFSTIIGISLALALILFSISLSGKVLGYVDLPSFLIVIGCTFLVSGACFSFTKLLDSFKSTFYVILYSPANPQYIATEALKTADYAYRNGILGLDKRHNETNDIFNKWLTLVVDGEKTANIEKLTSLEMETFNEQQNIVIQLLRKGAEVAPALGLIGTLIGLVQMLGSLDDISQIGPGMSVALLTTFYGAILAYVILFPLSSKLENNLKEDILNFRIYQRVVISISQQENPRNLEYALNSILPPGRNIFYYKQ